MSLISIIIPCFNYGNFLPETLNSILAQTFLDWECLIINDGSSDNTEAVAQEYLQKDTRFKYIYQENKGLSAARNTGISACTGKYIQFIDADDLIEVKKLEDQFIIFEENPLVDIVYSPVRYFRNQFPEERLFSMNRINRNWMPNVTGSGKTVLKFLLHRNIMAANCPLIRRSLFKKVGLFNEKLKYLEDWEFWLRCGLNNAFFYFLNKPGTFALVRVHGKSMTSNTWDMRYMELELKKGLESKVTDPELKTFLIEQIIEAKKTLVGISVYELLKGDINSFYTKVLTITEAGTLKAAALNIIKNKYLPSLTFGKILFYGKKLISNSK